MFPGESLKKQSSPLIMGGHPEIEDSVFVSEEEKAKSMFMIGTAQWLVTLGSFDITITISALSLLRVQHHKGHLKHTK